MKTVKLLTSYSENWKILFIDGKVRYEGPNIPDFVYLDTLALLGCDTYQHEITDKEAKEVTYLR